MSTEILRVQNFAGIVAAEIELSRMNVFIGPQASGKSVCAKLFYYFREAIIRSIVFDVAKGLTLPQMRVEYRERFTKFFPASVWSKGSFEIEYSIGDLKLKVTRKGSESSTVVVSHSDLWNNLVGSIRNASKNITLETDNELVGSTTSQLRSSSDALFSRHTDRVITNQNMFVPAGRSFFSTIRSGVFSFIAGNVGIDPFLTEFGRQYDNIRRNYHVLERNNKLAGNLRIKHHISKVICGDYVRASNLDYIHSQDGRLVGIENSSSGQQEALPLTLLLLRNFRSNLGRNHSTLYVEEPEAHLYPSAQREIVHLLSAAIDLTSDSSTSQYVITTHSPYILSALNNLMFGEQIALQKPNQRPKITEILNEANLIPPSKVRAYAFGNGKVSSIIDSETQLVRASMLDQVSNELASEFEKLVDIAYGEENI